MEYKTRGEVHFFKRRQKETIYHYYKVIGGPGRTRYGYQIVVNFLNEFPIISVEHNSLKELTGTWCQFEVGEPILESEFEEAYQKAANHPNVEIR